MSEQSDPGEIIVRSSMSKVSAKFFILSVADERAAVDILSLADVKLEVQQRPRTVLLVSVPE